MSSTTPSTSKKASAGGPSRPGARSARGAARRPLAGATIARSAGRWTSRRYASQSIPSTSKSKRSRSSGVQAGEQLARAAVVEDAVELDVGAVDLRQPAQPVEPALLLVQAQLELVGARERDAVDHAPAGVEQRSPAVEHAVTRACDAKRQSGTSTGRPSSPASGRSRK